MPIPKKIHYVWLGDAPLSERDAGFIAGWQKLNPDFTIRCWTEQDIDLDKYPLVRTALREKRWALASDVIRMYAIYHEGGVYMDTDVELLQPLAPFLKYDGFAGWEARYWFSTALFGAAKDSPWIEKALRRYELIDPDHKIVTNTFLKTVHAPSVYAQDIYGVKMDGRTREYADSKFATFASEYFSPKHYLTGKVHKTDKTVAFHHYASTWHSKTEKMKNDLMRATYKTLGRKGYEKLEKAFHATLEKEIRKELP
ncbi:hypothetical protein FWF89_00060 [Candidatus Saccharibacteria bacterium]|nr:hypothetical protein [Candidatus Saccharibacteria bacterium]